MPLVVDASIALAWALPDESNSYADAALAVVEQDGLRVPELWAREVANGLIVAHLRISGVLRRKAEPRRLPGRFPQRRPQPSR